jgi:hypothetical protein
MKEKPILIMELYQGFYGSIGTKSNVSSLGYGDIAEEYEELTLSPFYEATNGIVSEHIRLIEILDDGSLICLLDDHTEAIIKSTSLELLFNDIEEIFYGEYLARLEKQNGIKFTDSNQPEFDSSVFAKMIDSTPFYFKPFDCLGYFEKPSYIQDSIKTLELQIKNN